MNELALDAVGIFGASDARMSILAVGSPTRPYTLTQTDQNTVLSYLQTGRAIRSFIIVVCFEKGYVICQRPREHVIVLANHTEHVAIGPSSIRGHLRMA